MKNARKLKMYLRWAGNIILIDGLLKLTSMVIYAWLIYPLRKPVRWLWKKQGWYRWIAFPFWIFLNDGQSNDIGYDWFWRAKGIFPTNAWNRWRLSYLWTGLRNPVWNVYEFIHPKRGEIENMTILKGDGVDRILRWNLKDGTYNNNSGDYLNYSEAKLGLCHIEWSIMGVDYFRYTKALIKPIGKYFFHHELQIGWNNSRPKIRFKLIFKRKDKINKFEYFAYKLKKHYEKINA